MSATPEAGTQQAAPEPTKTPPRRGRPELSAARNRLGLYLITPTIVVLLVVIGYPVVRAVVMSFQNDACLDPATGLFVIGGFAVVIADVWKTTPFIALLILAGLQIIPEDVYEAAKVDGATAWQRFTRITLPLVRPALLVAVLFRTLDVLRIFDLPYILTQGANGTTTLSILVVNQIRQGFNSAAALSTITFLFIFLVAFVFVKVLGANVIGTLESERKGAR